MPNTTPRCSEQKLERIRKAIEKDPNLTDKALSERFGLSKTAIRAIRNKKFNIKYARGTRVKQ